METSSPWNIFAPITPRVLVFPVGGISESTFNGILSEMRVGLKALKVDGLGLGPSEHQFFQREEPQLPLHVDLEFIPVTSAYVRQYLSTYLSWDKISRSLSSTQTLPRFPMNARMSPTPLEEIDNNNIMDLTSSFLKPYNETYSYEDGEYSEEIKIHQYPPSLEVMADEQLFAARSSIFIIGLGLAPGKGKEEYMKMEDLLSAFSFVSRFEPKKHSSKNVLTLSELGDKIGFKLVIYDKKGNSKMKGLPNYLNFITPEVRKDEMVPIVRDIYGKIAMRGSHLYDSLRILKGIGGFSITSQEYGFDMGRRGQSTTSQTSNHNAMIPKEGFFIYDIANIDTIHEPGNVLDFLSPKSELYRRVGDDNKDFSNEEYIGNEKMRRGKRLRDRIKNNDLFQRLKGKELSSSSCSNSYDQSDVDSFSTTNLGNRESKQEERSSESIFNKVKSKAKLRIKGKTKQMQNVSDTNNNKISLSTTDMLSATYEESSLFLENPGHSRVRSKTQFITRTPRDQQQQQQQQQQLIYTINNATIEFRLLKLYADCLLIFGYIHEATEIYRKILSSTSSQILSDQLWLAAAQESMLCCIFLPYSDLSKCSKYTGKFVLRNLDIDAISETKHLIEGAERLYKGKHLISYLRTLFIRMVIRSWVYEQDDGTSEVKYLVRSNTITSLSDCFSKHLVDPSHCLWEAVHRLAKDKLEMLKAITLMESEGDSLEPSFIPTFEYHSIFMNMIDYILTIEPRNTKSVCSSEYASSYLYRLVLLATHQGNHLLSESLTALMILKLAYSGTFGPIRQRVAMKEEQEEEEQENENDYYLKNNKIQGIVCQYIKSGEVFIEDLETLFPNLLPFGKGDKMSSSITKKLVGDCWNRSTTGKLLLRIGKKDSNNVPDIQNVFPYLSSQLMQAIISLISLDEDRNSYDKREYDGILWNQQESFCPSSVNSHVSSQKLVNRLLTISRMNGIMLNPVILSECKKSRSRSQRSNSNIRHSNIRSSSRRLHLNDSSPHSFNRSRSNSVSCSYEFQDSVPNNYYNSNDTYANRSPTPVSSFSGCNSPILERNVHSHNTLQPFVLPFVARMKLNTTNPLLIKRDTDTDGKGNGLFIHNNLGGSNKKRKKGKKFIRSIHPMGLGEHIDVTLSLTITNPFMNENMNENTNLEINYVEGVVCNKDDKEEEEGFHKRVFFYSLPNKFVLRGNQKIRLMLFLEKSEEYVDLAEDKKYILLKHIRGSYDGDDVLIPLSSSRDSCVCFRPVHCPYINIVNSSYINRVGIRSVEMTSGDMNSVKQYIETSKSYIQPIYQNLPIHLSCELPTREEAQTPFCDIMNEEMYSRFQRRDGIDQSTNNNNNNNNNEETYNKIPPPAPLMIGITFSVSPHVEEIEFLPNLIDDVDSYNNIIPNSCNLNKSGGKEDGKILQPSEVVFSYCSSSSNKVFSMNDKIDYPIDQNKIKDPKGIISLWFEIWNKGKDSVEGGSKDPDHKHCWDNEEIGNDDYKHKSSIRIQLAVRSKTVERIYKFTYFCSYKSGSKCTLDNISLEGVQVPMKHLPPRATFNINITPNGSSNPFPMDVEGIIGCEEETKEREEIKNNNNNNNNNKSIIPCSNFFISLSVSNKTSNHVTLVSVEDFIAIDSLAPNSVNKCIIIVKEDKLYGTSTDEQSGILHNLLDMENEEEMGLYWVGGDGVPHTFAKQMDEVLGNNLFKNLAVLKRMVVQLYPRIKSVSITQLNNNKKVIDIDISKRLFSSISTSSPTFINENGESLETIDIQVEVTLQTRERHERLFLKMEDMEGLYDFGKLVDVSSSSEEDGSVHFETTLLNIGRPQTFFIYVEGAETRLCNSAFEWIVQ